MEDDSVSEYSLKEDKEKKKVFKAEISILNTFMRFREVYSLPILVASVSINYR
jgi:SNF2 family DNA or RNA helicase